MRTLTSLLLAILILGTSALAFAADLRRPYEAALAVSYGYDNSSASGCTDYNCGTVCYNGHSGSDFPLSLGTNVLAGADGVVTATNNSCNNYGYFGNTCGGRCGNYVQLRHPNGDLTIYCHMQRDTITVSTGQNVTCGQVIGKSASSGSSTGPHLHLGWRPGGGASTDVYSGSCNNSPGAWRQQNAYGQPPGASCGCVPSTEVCDGQDNNCDGTVDSGDVCEIDLLHEAPHAYTFTKTTDVTGDGRQELCARFAAGFRCYSPNDDGSLSSVISTSLMAEADGWGHPEYYSTIRMGDIDGDGRADVCARHPDGFTCWLSTGDDFVEFDTIGWSDSGNWNHPRYYTTIRLADINGNGRSDVCARGTSGWRCHLSTEDGFGPAINGPNWSDEQGFHRAQYYGTIRVGDLTGDGQDDVCIRRAAGFDCFRFDGDGFSRLGMEETLSNANGWNNRLYWPSLRLADIDGDGRHALCARNSQYLFCQRFDGEEFGERLVLGNLSNDSGWSDPTNYATLRVGDVTGDGSDDLCIRANARMLCYRVDDDDVTRFDGPEWSNANGWDALGSHGPLFITNLDDEPRGALCGRSADGLVCESYTDHAFELTHSVDQFTNSGGWNNRKYYSTLRMGRGLCRAGWCDPEPDPSDDSEDPEDPMTPGLNPDRFPSSDADDAGHQADADHAYDGAQTASTSSCAAAPTPAPSLPWLAALAILGLTATRRRLPALGTSLLAIGLIGLLGCDSSPEPTAEAVQTTPETAQATAETVQATDQDPAPPAGALPLLPDDLTVLAIHGEWRVAGEALPVGHGTDGPRRFTPHLFHGDSPVELPPGLPPVISEAAIFGSDHEPDYFFIVAPNGELHGFDLDSSRLITTHVTSQISPATDGCCLAFVRESDRGQTLDVLHLDSDQIRTRQLGYSIAWAPTLAPGGAEAIWTASPDGHATLIRGFITSDEYRALTPEDHPFPTGVHTPIWTPEGLAFESGEALYLVSSDGAPLAVADPAGGLFWDAAQQALVDHHGLPIDWRH